MRIFFRANFFFFSQNPRGRPGVERAPEAGRRRRKVQTGLRLSLPLLAKTSPCEEGAKGMLRLSLFPVAKTSPCEEGAKGMLCLFLLLLAKTSSCEEGAKGDTAPVSFSSRNKKAPSGGGAQKLFFEETLQKGRGAVVRKGTMNCQLKCNTLRDFVQINLAVCGSAKLSLAWRL